MSERRTLGGRLVAVVVGLAILLAVAEAGLRIVFPHWNEFFSGRFMTAITVPGYGRVAIGTPGFDGYFAQNNGDFRVHIAINAAGLRNDEPVEAAAGRLWVVGDSMTFGWGVERDETYTALLAAQTGVATYSVAAPGATVCGYQALVAHMPKTVRPRAVIVGLILENDLLPYDCQSAANLPATEASVPGPLTLGMVKRNLMEWSALYNVLSVSVKRVEFLLDLGMRLGLISVPHADDRAPAPETRDTLIRATADELARLREQVPGVPFAVLLAPARREIRHGDSEFTSVRRGLATALTERDLDVIDPFDRFRAAGFEPTHFAHDGHWSAVGHKAAAEAASAWVLGRGGSTSNARSVELP